MNADVHAMPAPQCLKLIILRITMMPTLIQIDAARQHQIADASR